MVRTEEGGKPTLQTPWTTRYWLVCDDCGVEKDMGTIPLFAIPKGWLQVVGTQEGGSHTCPDCLATRTP